MTNRRKYWTDLLCIALLGAAHGCKNAHNWNHPPPDLIPANCDLDGGYMTGTPPSAPSVICEDVIDRDAGAHGVAADDLPCRCRQWEQTNQYLPQTIPTDLVPILPPEPDAGAALCGVDNPKCYGCKGDELFFVWPDCCTVAGAIGTLVTDPEVARDEDYHFNLCTMQGSSYIPRTSISRELHTSDSYKGKSTLPKLHVEVQECRLFDGTHTFSLPDDLPGDPPHVLEARPLPGDLVSVAGDWVDDRGHGSEKPYWTEIHEARALAVTRRIDDYTSVATMSFHFAYGGTQQRIVELRVPALPSPDPVLFDRLNCAIVPAVEDPDCGPPAGAATTYAVPNPPVGPPYCKVTFKRDPDFDTQMDENRCHYRCDGETFQERFAEHGCNHVYTAVVRMWWTNPGDLWLCRSCACADPATNGTTFITAPVQGCARLGLDPTNPADQALACQEVCGGEMCGASGDCDIGECHPPPAGGVAELVARQVCDPTKQPFTHVAEAGDYRVVLDPTESFVTFNAYGESVQDEPVSGELYLNVDAPQQGGFIELAEVTLSTGDFTIHDKSIQQPALVAGERLTATYGFPPDFFMGAGRLVLAVRANIDGNTRGYNVSNPQAIQGTFDPTSGLFTLDVEAADPDPDSDSSLTATLVGWIENRPPVADAGDLYQQVECTSPTTTSVLLDGSGSHDPDAGDLIAHYQWFDPFATGLGDTAQVTEQLLLGESRFFTLRVYDQKLGADAAVVQVSVVDTTPPALQVQPTGVCLTPPNHRRVRYRLLEDIGVVVSDRCDPAPTVRIVSATSDEPDDGQGDGNTQGDVVFGATGVCVRRERSGTGTDRHYQVVIEARDANDNTSQQTVTITVPHDGFQGCVHGGTEISDSAPCP